MTDRDALIKEVRENAMALVAEHGTMEDGSVNQAIVDYGESMNKAADMLEALPAPGDADAEAVLKELCEAPFVSSSWRRKAEDLIRQLLRRPVEPVVTDEMVEKFGVSYCGQYHWDNVVGPKNKAHIRRALETALNVSQPGVK